MAQENIQISVPIIGTTANPVAYANQIKDGNTTQSDINTALLKDTADLKQDVEGLTTDIAGIEEEVDSKIDGVTFATTKDQQSVILGQGATFRIEPGTGIKVDRASIGGEPIDGAILSVDTDVIPTPDEEDLTNVNVGGTGVLKFKDKAYNPADYSGLGRVYLRKNMIILSLPFDGFLQTSPLIEQSSLADVPDAIFFDVQEERFVCQKGLKYYINWQNNEGYLTNLTNGDLFSYDNKYYEYNNGTLTVNEKPAKTNVLTQSMINQANTIYHIQYDFDLNEETITIPEGCVLEFDGGSLRNGVLVGTLLTSDGFIDLRSLGVVYNNSASATANANALNILSGVTNEVKLKVSGEVYLGGSQSVNAKYINLDGNGNTIHIDYFSGFVVSDGVTIRNCKVVTEEWASAKNYFNMLVKVQNVIHPIDVLFENNYFNGSMRVISAYKIADSGTSVCMNSVRIINNVFEEITCGNTSNVIFHFENSNFVNFEVRDNYVHNFYAEFIKCSSTNGSEYVEYINNFYAQKERNYEIVNNQVRNELSFRPWETITSALTYFAFVVAEYGICTYKGNTITNIIGGNMGGMTYDAYLSVDILNYYDNAVRNVINITGSENQILKSKNGGNHKIRRYVRNKFVLEDISDDVGVDITSLEYFLVDTASLSEQFVLSENVIEFCHLMLKAGYKLYANQLIVRGNKINIAKAVTMSSGNNSPLFPLWTDGVYAIIKDNDVNIISATAISPSLFYAQRVNCSVNVSGNKLTNTMLYGSNDNRDITGKCYNNNVSFSDNAIALDDSSINIVAGYENGIEFKDNKVTDNISKTWRIITRMPQSYDVDIVSPTNHSFYVCYRVTMNCRYVLEVMDENGKVILLSEMIISVENSTYAITAYDKNRNFIENATARTNLCNFAGSNLRLSYNNRELQLENTPEKFHIKARVYYNDTKLSLNPTSGISSKRPNSAMINAESQYFDTTLGNPIYFNGTKWVDTKGMTAGVHKGNTEYRGGMPIGTLTEADWYGALDSTPEFNGFKNGVAQTQGDAAGTGTPHAIYFDRIRGKFLFESEDPNIPGNYLYWEKWVGSTYTPFVNPTHGTIYKENDNYWKYIAPKTNATLKLDPATDIGYEYFDTDLGKMVYAKSIAADGTASWVDANGMSC